MSDRSGQITKGKDGKTKYTTLSLKLVMRWMEHHQVIPLENSSTPTGAFGRNGPDWVVFGMKLSHTAIKRTWLPIACQKVAKRGPQGRCNHHKDELPRV
ncbi:Protein PRRC2B, partial [Ophiophagus hannah]